MAKHVLLPLVAAAALAFAAIACGGGGEEEAEVRPLPEEQRALSPGTYSSVKFEPSFTFEVGEGWTTLPPATSDDLALSWETRGGLGFANIREVYEPTGTGTPNVVEAPDGMVLWFKQHPLLQTDKAQPVTVGGVEGVRFDVVVENLPEDHHDVCGSDCVDIFRTAGGSTVGISEGEMQRIIVLEDVKGETVTVGFGTLATQFDEFAPQAQKVLETVEWTGK